MRLLQISAMLLAAASLASCKYSDQPLLSFLTNKRMTVILKGTYATDNPLTMQEVNGDTLFTDGVDEPLDLTTVPNYSALPIYLDIGEIRLSTKQFLDPLYNITTAKDSEKFWDVIAPTRQVYCSQPYAISFDNDSCFQTGGLINYQEFMNGRGALYPSTDVGPGVYLHAGIWMRNIVTGYSKASGGQQLTKFDNNDVVGTDVQTLLNYDAGIDAATKQALAPETFPFHHAVTFGQQATMVVDHSTAAIVVELRINLKENLMVHSFINANNLDFTVVTASDWRVNHVRQFDMGGNILTRARMFYPDLTSDLYINGGTYTAKNYYAVYGANECGVTLGNVFCNQDLDFLPLAATPVRNGGNVIKNLMPGDYVGRASDWPQA
ncbi:MAG: hypothetical protein HY042_09535 [Spirochaetia bacterium]|nr:hypothetical protein [Spirochaetia bacterium]